MIRIEDIIEATGGKILSEGKRAFSGICIDSRTIQEGDLFVALKGERFDGHDFVADALRKGAGALLHCNAQCAMGGEEKDGGLRSADYTGGKTVVLVDDTLRALQDLARFLRKRFGGLVIGVVGSNGKTTTKELTASILGTRGPVHKTTGNLNNHIGMPLSLTRMEEGVAAMVLEMGTNRPGDVKELCGIALPDIGVITNIGYEHLEGFGSLEKVRDAEMEILPYVKKLVVNADDRFLLGGIGAGFAGERITFGIETRNADVSASDVRLSDEGVHFTLRVGREQVAIRSHLSGYFNVYNSLAAAAAAYAAGFRPEEIRRGLEAFEGVKMRFEIRRQRGVTILNDSYNANPSSMEVSVRELARRVSLRDRASGRAIAVLGDMLELGDYAVPSHRELGRKLSQEPVDIFIGVGPLMALAVEEFGEKGMHRDTSREAGIELAKMVREGDIVLIKGSRGMRMERVLTALEEEVGPPVEEMKGKGE
ncbi:MAG: UDP-N-acetylmuramoyl-tripeptide--D-alanyl-D-alanine ligase [Alphaproteobacteria bacterium]|uniref:UDP-N-acetylmuramoyl-tripeptide--D-alanyl-D-alanine ligase n=1 Tax=Candidatus Nitrobium versatile TaxID=2884831 RepID=A0A953M321_9BACT|nr:UDP-N-acetylmuramoyl-tripeptide--D-alanyl-D-alanine ligase [Candidatus Nitrobium versatile]